MPEGPQHDLLLILARDLAANLANAFFVVDDDGQLVYYNERAEELLGQSFADARLNPDTLVGTDWQVTDLDDEPLPRDRWPLTVAVREQRPAHGSLRLTARDGKRRTLAATAFPLLGVQGGLVGACSIFWEQDEDA